MFRSNPFSTAGSSTAPSSNSVRINRPTHHYAPAEPTSPKHYPPISYFNNSHNPPFSADNPSLRKAPRRSIHIHRSPQLPNPARAIHINGPPTLQRTQPVQFPPRTSSLTPHSKPLPQKSPLKPNFSGVRKPVPLSLFPPPPRSSSLITHPSSAARRRSPRLNPGHSLYPTIHENAHDRVFDSPATFEARHNLADDARTSAWGRTQMGDRIQAGDEGRRKAEEWARRKAEIRRTDSETWKAAQREATEMGRRAEKRRRIEERAGKRRDCVVM